MSFCELYMYFGYYCPETNWNIYIRKQCYMFINILITVKVCNVSFLVPICVNNYFRLSKVFKQINYNLISILLTGFVKLKAKQWFLKWFFNFKTHFVLFLETAQVFFQVIFFKETCFSFFSLLVVYNLINYSEPRWDLPSKVKHHLNSQNSPAPF